MKSTDLIPIILYQLKDQDKYGLEIVDSIIKCSDNKIDVKQATLYPLLKKLEKSRFISSYWQDSEIGGKRHYYKITENGLAQLETYPDIDELVNVAVLNDAPTLSANLEEPENDEKDDSATTSNVEQIVTPPVFDETPSGMVLTEIQSTDFSNLEIKDLNAEEIKISPIENENFKESELPDSKESTQSHNAQSPILSEFKPKKTDDFDIFNVLSFDDETQEDKKDIESIDEISQIDITQKADNFEDVGLINPFKDKDEKKLSEKTNLEINESNAKLMTDQPKSETFAEDKKVTTFIKKNIMPSIDTEIKSPIPNVFESKDIGKQTTKINDTYIEYRDYIDYKNDSRVIETKNNARTRLLKNTASCVIALIWLAVMLVFSVRAKITPLFSVVFSLTTLYVVFAFCKFLGNYRSIKLDIDNRKIKYNFKKQLLIRVIITVLILLTLLVVNLVFIKDGKLISKENFSNFLAPIVLLILLYTDYLLAYIFYRKSVKSNEATD